MNTTRMLVPWAAGFCLLAQPVALAQERDEPESGPVSVLAQAADFFSSMNTLSGRSTSVTKAQMMGTELEIEQSCRFALERPNRVRASYSDMEGDSFEFVSDGDHLFQHHDFINTYIAAEGPATFRRAVARGVFDHEPTLDLVVTMPHLLMLTLASGESGSEYLTGLGEWSEVGVERVGEQEANHLLIDGEQLDVHLWFARGDEPWILKMELDLTQKLRQMTDVAEGEDEVEMLTTITFSDWERDAPAPPDRFAFEPPRGSKRVDSVEAFLEAQEAFIGHGG